MFRRLSPRAVTLQDLISGEFVKASDSLEKMACSLSKSFEVEGALIVRGQELWDLDFGNDDDFSSAAHTSRKTSFFPRRNSGQDVYSRSYSVLSAPDHLGVTALDLIRVTRLESLVAFLDRYCDTLSYELSSSGHTGRVVEQEFSSSWSALPAKLRAMVIDNLESLFVPSDGSQQPSAKGLVQMASYNTLQFFADHRQVLTFKRSQNSTAPYDPRPEVNSSIEFNLQGYKAHPKIDLFSLGLPQRTLVAMLLVQQVPFSDAIARVAAAGADVSLWASMFTTFITDGFSTRDAWLAASNI